MTNNDIIHNYNLMTINIIHFDSNCDKLELCTFHGRAVEMLLFIQQLPLTQVIFAQLLLGY